MSTTQLFLPLFTFFQSLKGDQPLKAARLGDKKSLRTDSISSVLNQLQSPYSQSFFMPGSAFFPISQNSS